MSFRWQQSRRLSRLSFVCSSHSVYLSWCLRLCLLFSLVALLIFFVGDSTERPDISQELRHLQALRDKDISSTCRVPITDPWDPTILKYYQKTQPLRCTPVQEVFATLKNGFLTEFDASKVKDLLCFLTPFVHNEGVTDAEALFLNSTQMDFSKNGYTVEVQHEFFEVYCAVSSMFDRVQYKMHFAQIIPHNYSTIVNPLVEIKPSSPEHPSVIMIGLDSMSRGNFIRQLPRTHNTMQRMGFQDMLGHIKIGENTYINWLAILTGKRGVSSREFDAEIDESWDIAFDDIDMVWKNFSKNGYATLFAEDRPDIGTFNYMGYLCGFRNTPTDHYFHTYWLAAYWSIVARRSSPFCYDVIAKHNTQLEYLQEFITKYRGKRHFSFWWSQDMSHDFLNTIGSIDDDLDGFLKRNEHLLDESIVILFSDHGHRYDQIRQTVVGRLESRLPYHSIRIPPSIREKYPHIVENLAANSAKMTTQYDVNESLNKIATGEFVLESLQSPDSSKTSKGFHPIRRAYSYFHPTPDNRTCYDANIPEDFCPCYTETEIPASEAEKPTQLAYSCLKLELSSVLYSSVRLPPRKLIEDPKNGMNIPDHLEIQYRIVFVAAPPSNAVIEGIVSKNFQTGVWSATGEIERNNMYGNSSHCVMDRMLKKICHCVARNTNSSQKVTIVERPSIEKKQNNNVAP